ncbi:uncharacterized protein VICG_00244 [Vittaforma corneae ATCC 50505]|uniref:AAA+ ATPase domain-containing protein n=1 Tax=Vittaforma corneae (strain ATCC 50505) TaxID=993615 RepID=L2GQM6_VITCO|nr:uncharacterized protein VICG_00244 [Vittaforma corneae ATCC 50505]ELA42929.1 hypothetical protein VICG_00244 [Vittaforma corneae ATCC 50505]
MKENMLIQSAIKKYGNEILIEDKTFDLVAAIVYKRIKYAFSKSLDDEKLSKSEKKSGFGVMNTMFVILFVIAVISFINSLVSKKDSTPLTNTAQNQQGAQSNVSLGIQNAASQTNKDGTVVAGQFEFKTGNQIKFNKYCGRKKDYDVFYGLIKRYIEELTNLSREELDEINAFTKLNFLLEGPAGTGKTIFVHYLATQIDKYLKLKALAEENPELYRQVLSNEAVKETYLSMAPSRIYFCEVAPGIINSKWYGDTEKNVSLLFDYAKKLSEEKWRAVFLFFDEGDAFFSKRNADTSMGETTSGLKSELLQRIGVRPSDKYRPIFVFCATNRFEVFDDGFKRRFGNQTRFAVPTLDERREFVKFVFDDFVLQEKEIETIVNLTQGRTQSFISKYMRNYYIEDELSRVTGIKLKEFVKFLYDNRGDRNLI